jgi:hypothetical protein
VAIATFAGGPAAGRTIEVESATKEYYFALPPKDLVRSYATSSPDELIRPRKAVYRRRREVVDGHALYDFVGEH